MIFLVLVETNLLAQDVFVRIVSCYFVDALLLLTSRFLCLMCL